jgi:hypothetical protein
MGEKAKDFFVELKRFFSKSDGRLSARVPFARLLVV